MAALQQPVLDRSRAAWGEDATLHVAAGTLIIAAAEQCRVHFEVIPPAGSIDGEKVFGPRPDLFPENLRVGHPDLVQWAALMLAAALNGDDDMAIEMAQTVGNSGQPDTRFLYQCATAVFRTVCLAVASKTVL
jgi:hypothetical protein